MRFITSAEAVHWASRYAKPGDPAGHPEVPAPSHSTLRVAFENEPGHRTFYLAQQCVEALGYFDECLLWVTQTGVWPSNENLHLYYRLRQSYGDLHLVSERPGIRAFRHEAVDLSSFVQLSMLFGWELFLLSSHDYGRVFISHDGWFVLSEASPEVIPRLSAPVQVS